MPEKMKKITEGTLVPISLVVTLIGGVLWLAAVHSDAREAKEGLKDLKDAQEQAQQDCAKTFISIDERLSRIEGRLAKMVGE